MTDTTRAVFRKSRHSSADFDCVEVGLFGEVVKVRDSKAPNAGTLDIPVDEARRLFRALRGL